MFDISKMVIHTMSIKDLDEIKDSLYENFNNFWTYEIFKSELANNTNNYLVCRYNNEIVCYGGLKFILNEAELMNIVTKKDMRRARICKFYTKCFTRYSQRTTM